MDNAQLERLSRLHLDEVVVLADADDGGNGTRSDVDRRLGSLAGALHHLELRPKAKDVGELSTAEAKRFPTRVLAA